MKASDTPTRTSFGAAGSRRTARLGRVIRNSWLLATLPGLLLAWVPARVAEDQRLEPNWFRFDRSVLDACKQEPVARFAGRDKQQQYTLQLLCDASGTPLLYYADVTTPVCSQGVCQPVRIGLYWSLVGDYVGFGVPGSLPLVKYDDVRFEPSDYLRLHEILTDSQSVLGCRPLTGMVDPSTAATRSGAAQTPSLDAWSGATSKDYQDAVVPGALYTCHTLWHLVRGAARDKILTHLPTIATPKLYRQFLYSREPAYQLCAIEQWDEAELVRHHERVLRAVTQADSGTRRLMLAKLPAGIWREEAATRSIYAHFGAWDVDTRTVLLERLAEAHLAAGELLARQLESMKKEQLRQYLAFLAADAKVFTAPIRARLEQIVREERYAYCYVVAGFLDQ